MSFRLVLIEWQDSHATGEWHSVVDLMDKPLVCKSVGWLVLDGENVTAIAPHINQEDEGDLMQVCGVMSIPKADVLRLVDLPTPISGDPA